ncbi:hypothetical protein [Brytella acorum]|uniref:Uncharacterized protein n=1 Tax=Brytella acorum TaxID=2959299 RepID=A0AA35UEF5_9PROT|nr:hypothetical protein [Brytella acorum]CAI9119532.1 hypothetical protein LMG32879_000349 [Brytella acorum]
MTWTPCCQRTVSVIVPAAFRLRGLNAPMLLRWPSAAIGASADYSVDFRDLLCDGERIVRAEISVGDAGSLAWESIFGSCVTGWITWSSVGCQQVSVTAVTSEGVALTCSVGITIAGTSLITPTPPEYAPNAYVIGDVIVPDADGNPLILG